MQALFVLFFSLNLLTGKVSSEMGIPADSPRSSSITLLAFKGQAGPEGVMLEWASTSEKNVDSYMLERSADGINFEIVTRVKGTGNSVHRLDYSYVDRGPRQGVSYYRLRLDDLDGRTELFNVVRVYWEQTTHSAILGL